MRGAGGARLGARDADGAGAFVASGLADLPSAALIDFVDRAGSGSGRVRFFDSGLLFADALAAARGGAGLPGVADTAALDTAAIGTAAIGSAALGIAAAVGAR